MKKMKGSVSGNLGAKRAMEAMRTSAGRKLGGKLPSTKFK